MTATVEAVDASGRLLAAEFARLLPLLPVDSHDEKRIIQLPTANATSLHWLAPSTTALEDGRAQFDVRGLSLGATQLSVSTRFAGSTIVSNTVDLQVGDNGLS